MTKPKPGNYLFVHYGYAGDKSAPTLTLLGDGNAEFEHLNPRDSTLTLKFDTSKRLCVGWHDLETSRSYPCPDQVDVSDQYDQCHHCRHKTGFNPAFYNSANISEQQQARNRLPHSLYLAHFGPGMVKVGISWAGRGIARLLDQGARSAIILKTYPNAEVARQYEAKIAKLPGIAETLQVRAKHSALNSTYDSSAGASDLQKAIQRVVQECGVIPEKSEPIFLDTYYLADNKLLAGKLIDMSKQNHISGQCVGMIGGILVCTQDSEQYTLPLSKLKGYQVALSYSTEPMQHAPQQISLF
ncbi:MAG TPA: DUF2797 domain-containing protein [Patescibacteria group bacterium]|jgi:hypothetical protein|nr:DUF2797 domain-containing protein [Patescibacteria group bacterium]